MATRKGHEIVIDRRYQGISLEMHYQVVSIYILPQPVVYSLKLHNSLRKDTTSFILPHTHTRQRLCVYDIGNIRPGWRMISPPIKKSAPITELKMTRPQSVVLHSPQARVYSRTYLYGLQNGDW